MTSYAVRPNVVAAEIDGDVVVMDAAERSYFALNETASRVWTIVAAGDGKSAEDVCLEVGRMYPATAPDRMSVEIESLLARLCRAGLLVEVDGADPTAGS